MCNVTRSDVAMQCRALHCTALQCTAIQIRCNPGDRNERRGAQGRKSRRPQWRYFVALISLEYLYVCVVFDSALVA